MEFIICLTLRDILSQIRFFSFSLKEHAKSKIDHVSNVVNSN